MKNQKIDEYKLLKKSKKYPKKSRKLIKDEKNKKISRKKFLDFFECFSIFHCNSIGASPSRRGAGSPRVPREKYRKKRDFFKKNKKNTMKSKTSKNPRKKLIFCGKKTFLPFFFEFRPYSLYNLYIAPWTSKNSGVLKKTCEKT